ncbi:MAG: Ig-like domain-containing protein, partial [Clostridia bacterium]
MKKKILALVLALTMLICAIPSQAYTVRDAYAELSSQYPEFIEAIVEQGASESLIISFLSAIQNRLYNVNRTRPITEENFEDNLIDAVIAVSNASAFSSLQTALYNAYPDAAYNAMIHHRIDDEFMPLYESVKAMVFEHGMLENIDNDASDTVGIVSVADLDSITVEQGDDLSLPEKVETASEFGSTVMLEIEWKSVPSTSEAGTYTAQGELIVPDGFALSDGVSGQITVSVKVTAKKDDS